MLSHYPITFADTAFEVDGRIVLSCDRFDPIDVGWSFVRGAGRALLGRAR